MVSRGDLGGKKNLSPGELTRQEEWDFRSHQLETDSSLAATGLLDMLGVPPDKRSDNVFLTACTIMKALQTIVQFGKSPPTLRVSSQISPV